MSIRSYIDNELASMPPELVEHMSRVAISAAETIFDNQALGFEDILRIIMSLDDEPQFWLIHATLRSTHPKAKAYYAWSLTPEFEELTGVNIARELAQRN